MNAYSTVFATWIAQIIYTDFILYILVLNTKPRFYDNNHLLSDVDVEVDQTEVVASTEDLTALLSCTVKGSPEPLVSICSPNILLLSDKIAFQRL